MDFNESIPVLGPEHAGKKTLFKRISEPIPKQWRPGVEQPFRFRFNPDRYPELEKTVFTVYNRPSQLKMDLPERNGIIVLNLAQLYEFAKPDALTQYSLFFRFLRKMVWLGVDRFVLAITHMDLAPVNATSTFHDVAALIASNLERIFECRIYGPIPLTRGISGFDNVFHGEPQDVFPWNGGPTLMDALIQMTSSRITCPNSQSLWALGEILGKGEHGKVQWKPLHVARGKIERQQRVRVYPDGLEATSTIRGNKLWLHLETKETVNLNQSSANQPCVILEANSPANKHWLLGVHAVLDRQFSISNLQEANRSFSFTLFGPQNAEGDLNESKFGIRRFIPISAKAISELSGLSSVDAEEARLAFGQEVYLRVECWRTPVVAHRFSKDADAGRILIWETSPKSGKHLVGAGRIIDFPNILTQDVAEKLVLFDQYRANERTGSNLLIFILEKIYHDSKHLVANQPSHLNEEYARKFTSAILDDYDLILTETRTIKSRIDKRELGAELRNLHPHLVSARNRLFTDFKMLRQLIVHNKTEESVQILLDHLKEEYIRETEYIRNQCNSPLEKAVAQATDQVPHQRKAKVKLHNCLSKDWNYFPKDPETLRLISEAISNLISNTFNYANSPQSVRVDIFIDPPDITKPECVKIQYQDNGIIGKENLRKMIENRTDGGLNTIMNKFKEAEAQLKLQDDVGPGTSFEIIIPTWLHRLETIENSAADLTNVLCAIDYKAPQASDTCSSFLSRLDSILQQVDRSTMLQNLRVLILDAQASSQHCGSLRIPDFQYLTPQKSSAFTDIGELRSNIQRLLDFPVYHALRAAISDAKCAFPTFFIDNRVNPKALPLHKIESAAFYRSIVHTFSWALTELIIPELLLDFETIPEIRFHVSPQHTSNCISVRLLSVPAIPDAVLIPLRTRLSHLGIGSEFGYKSKDVLICHLPVHIVSSREKGGKSHETKADGDR